MIGACKLIAILAVLVALLVWIPAPATEAPGDSETTSLVWHVETEDGDILDSRDADAVINPASVVKLGTTLRALEKLGPEHRFATRFGMVGTFDPSTGVLEGDLVVSGEGDPDFHVENAYLVARELNLLGLFEVRGRLLVDNRFWIGWEGGSARRRKNEAERGAMMASRLKDALDPGRWSRETTKAIAEFAARRDLEAEPPRVVVRGAAAVHAGVTPDEELAVHRSNPLSVILKRFNAYSNNDIERFQAHLGPPSELAAFLQERLGVEGPRIDLATHSGLGANRMSARQVVGLLRELERTCKRLNLQVEDILPAAGCDPGTMKHFPDLVEAASPGGLVAKTGTLTTTDGGIVMLAGRLHTGWGVRYFCLGSPGVGRRVRSARAEQESWLMDLGARQGGISRNRCGQAVLHSDRQAKFDVVARPDAPATSADGQSLR